MYGSLLVCVFILRGFQCIGAAEGEDIESQLRKKLFEGYDKTLSAFLFSESLHKEVIWVSLSRIQDLDEATSTLTVEAMVGLGWTDERLKWNRTEYNNTYYVGIPPSEVWTPRLWILNHVKSEEQVGDTRALVFSNSFVWVGRKYALHTSCVPNLKYFPFDKQKCVIEVATITQSDELMELNVTLPNFSKYRGLGEKYLIENTRWKLLNTTEESANKTLLDGQVVNIDLFTLEIQRTTPLIAMAIMSPAVMSVILVLSGFWISPGCPVRMGISMTGAFVSMSTLFTLTRVLPVTGVVTPIIVGYTATSLILILLFSIHTCLLSLAIRSTTPFPFPYHVLLERIPSWALRLLGSDDVIPKETTMNQVLLYSELTETDPSHENSKILSPGAEPQVNPVAETFSSTSTASSEWLKPMILLDKICFYVYILITVLYVLSVIIEE